MGFRIWNLDLGIMILAFIICGLGFGGLDLGFGNLGSGIWDLGFWDIRTSGFLDFWIFGFGNWGQVFRFVIWEWYFGN